MRARELVGRRVVAVRQYPVRASSGVRKWTVQSIVLDNGTVLIPSTIELDSADGYGTEFLAVRRERERRKP